jgi:cell division protein ZapA
MAEVDLIIAGRPYRVACRSGEEESLRAAARLVDAKSREAISGLGTLSEARQLLFAGLLLADQLLDTNGGTAPVPAAAPEPPPVPRVDPALAERAARLASRLESLADSLENAGPSA